MTSLSKRLEQPKPKPDKIPEWRRRQLERLAKVGRVAEKALDR